MVGARRFELRNQKEQIYSLPRLTTSLNPHGAENRNRTRNLLITSQLLYQLSYFGIRCEATLFTCAFLQDWLPVLSQPYKSTFVANSLSC